MSDGKPNAEFLRVMEKLIRAIETTDIDLDTIESITLSELLHTEDMKKSYTLAEIKDKYLPNRDRASLEECQTPTAVNTPSYTLNQEIPDTGQDPALSATTGS